MEDPEGSMAAKLRESFDLLISKIARCVDKARVTVCFADHSPAQQAAAYEKVTQMGMLFMEAAKDEFHDVCVEKKIIERLNHFYRLCELQGVVERDGKLVVTRPALSAVQPETVALEQRLLAKRGEVEELQRLIEQAQKDKAAMRAQLAEKQAEANQVRQVFASAGEEARQQREALVWASRRSALQRRRSSRQPTKNSDLLS